jgi:hypothetical protein
MNKLNVGEPLSFGQNDILSFVLIIKIWVSSPYPLIKVFQININYLPSQHTWHSGRNVFSIDKKANDFSSV